MTDERETLTYEQTRQKRINEVQQRLRREPPPAFIHVERLPPMHLIFPLPLQAQRIAAAFDG